MTMKVSTSSILKIACYISLFIFALPFVDYFCPWYVNVIPIAMVMLVAFTTKRNHQNMIKILLLAVVISFLGWYFLHRNQELGTYMINKIIAFLPIVMAGQLERNVFDKKFYRNYLQIGLILMSITSITTYIGLELYPFASRELATGSIDEFSLMNIGGYEYIYSLVLLIPITCWFIKHSKNIWKIVNIICLITYVACIYQSQYTFAVIGIAIAFILILAQKKPKLALGVSAVVVGFLLLNGWEALASIFKTLSEWIPLDYIADRFLQVSQFISGEEINTETSAERVMLMMRAVESIAEKWLFGHNWDIFNAEKLSGHSYILDCMASGGVVMVSIFGFAYKCFYRWGMAAKGKAIPKALVSVWILLGMMALVNPIVFFLNFMVLFIFGMCVRKLQEAEEQEI